MIAPGVGSDRATGTAGRCSVDQRALPRPGPAARPPGPRPATGTSRRRRRGGPSPDRVPFEASCRAARRSERRGPGRDPKGPDPCRTVHGSSCGARCSCWGWASPCSSPGRAGGRSAARHGGTSMHRSSPPGRPACRRGRTRSWGGQHRGRPGPWRGDAAGVAVPGTERPPPCREHRRSPALSPNRGRKWSPGSKPRSPRRTRPDRRSGGCAWTSRWSTCSTAIPGRRSRGGPPWWPSRPRSATTSRGTGRIACGGGTC